MSTGKSIQQPKLWSFVFVVIIAITLCVFIIGQGTNAGSTVYVSRLGGTTTLAGIGAATFSISAAFARLFAGPLTDNRGRLIVMASGTFILLLGVIGPGITATLDLFVFWRFVQGVGFAGATTAAATAAADVLPVERLGEGIGYYGLGQALAMAIGPALSLALVATDPAENLYWGLAIAGVFACILCFFCRYESHPERLPETSTYRTLAAKHAEIKADQAKQEESTFKRIVDSVFEPGALAGGIPLMVLCPVMGFNLFYAGLLGAQLNIDNAGLFFTMSAVSMIAVRLASKKFMDRVAAIKIHTVAVLGALITYAVFIYLINSQLDASVKNLLFYAAGIPYGLCPGLAISINQAVAVKNSSEERWGAANSLYLLLTDIGIGIASVMWGITNHTFGFQFSICGAAIFAIASIGVAMLCYPKADRVWRPRHRER